MNILVLNYEFPPLGGGAAPISKELAVRMAQRGHKVDVVTMGYGNLPHYEEIKGVRVYRVKCLRSKLSSCQSWEQFSYIVCAKKVIKELINCNHYDICHTHFVVPTGVLALYVKRKYGLKYMITAHGSDVEGYNTKKSNLIVHKLIRKPWVTIVRESEATYAPSNYLIKLMGKRYHGKYSVIPNGIDLNLYQFTPGNKKEHRILFVGRLQSTKNVQAIIRAASMVSLGDWTIDIVGDGPYRKELESLARECGIQDSVVFHGRVENGSKEHISILNKAALFISESYFESFGVAVVEAIASGCSIILSDIEAHRMFAKDEDCFTDPDDIESLSKKIGEFIKGEKTFSSDRGIIEKFAWEHVTDLYEKEYMRIAVNK